MNRSLALCLATALMLCCVRPALAGAPAAPTQAQPGLAFADGARLLAAADVPASKAAAEKSAGKTAGKSPAAAKAKTAEKPLDPQVKALLESAQKGDASAQNELGARYEHGQGLNQDVAVAAQWYQKAAEAGDAMGQWNLSRLYGNGRVCPRMSNWRPCGAARPRTKATCWPCPSWAACMSAG